MASGDWKPGLSDLDLAVLAPEVPPGRDWESFAVLRRRLAYFRVVFPFTSEVLISPARAFSALVSSWGLKGEEFRSASRVLAGLPLPPPPAGPGGPADLTEAFYSYTILFSHFAAAGLPPSFRARNCAKGLADVLRCLDPDSPARGSRRDYAAARGLDLDVGPGTDAGVAAFEAFRALHVASPAADAGARPDPGGPAWFNRHVFESACSFMREEAGCDAGVVLDSLYRVYLVLPDGAAADGGIFFRACRALGAAREKFSCFSAAPLVLTRSSFALLSRLPYLNNPLFRTDLSVPASGLSPADGGVFLWNMVAPPPAPPEPSGVRFAAVHFAATWRSLWGEMPPHYFYTRAAGLRLLTVTGDSPPFARPSEISSRSAAVFGEDLSWEAFRSGGAGRDNYEFTARQCAAMTESADAG